jgi:branched-subunit amino acid aminotransferase/4-amino-4-deoxychorismate lyase
VAAVAISAPRPLARLRITVTRETCLVTASPYTPPEGGTVSAALLRGPWVFSDSPLAGLKSLSRQANRLALRHAQAAGAFEALLLNERGLVAEGSRSNVIVALPEGVFTPPLEDGCLPGIIRGYLLASGTVAERSITPDDLRRAKQVILTNSLIGALPVVKLVSSVQREQGG